MAFEIIITSAGRAAIAALTGTDQVVISQIGVSQTHQIVSWATTALTNETKRLTTFGGTPVDAQTMSIQMLDDSADSYNLRSFALYTSTGVLFAIYSQSAIISAKTAASLLLLQIDITLTALGTAAITFGDTNFVNPPASDTRQGVARIATLSETIAGVLQNVIVSPARLKGLLDQWVIDIPQRLGFNPVQQGGGVGQGVNKLFLGWSSSTQRLKAQVEGTDLGSICTDFDMRQHYHSLNDGAGSGLDADLLDGFQGEAYARIETSLINEQNGYIRFANGLKECWGFMDIAADNHNTWTLPTPHASWVNIAFGHVTYNNLLTQTEDIGIVEIIKVANIPTGIKFWNGQNETRRVFIQTKGV